MESVFTFKRDGRVMFGSFLVARWWYENIWERQGGRRDRSGNLTIRGWWHCNDILGKRRIGYTKTELVEQLMRNFDALMTAKKTLTDEQKEDRIRFAK